MIVALRSFVIALVCGVVLGCSEDHPTAVIDVVTVEPPKVWMGWHSQEAVSRYYQPSFVFSRVDRVTRGELLDIVVERLGLVAAWGSDGKSSAVSTLGRVGRLGLPK